MLSENCFLDIIADVNPDYVEEVLFMPQFAQNNKELEKYRKKSGFGKIFGSVAACVAVIGLGITAIILQNRGFFDSPAESNTPEVTTVSESTFGEVTSAEETTGNENNVHSTDNTPDPYDYQELIIALEGALDKSETFEEMFETFGEIDVGRMIGKITVYKSAELRDQGIAMKEEELKGVIGDGTHILVYFSDSETDYVEMGKTIKNRALPEGVVLQGLAGDDILPEDIKEVSYDNPENSAAWGSVYCEGFCYLSEPDGYCFNNLENPEMFDPDTGSYIDNITSAQPKKRYNVGDEICGLKVKSAGFSLMNMYGDNDHSDGCRASNSASFEGSVELTGYLCVREVPYYTSSAKYVYFVPDNESGKKLPVLGTPWVQIQREGSFGSDFLYSWENPAINCGSAGGYPALADCELDKAVKAKITLTDFSLSFNQGGPEDSFADGLITDIELQ